MTDSIVLSVRIDKMTKKRLAKLAESTKRSQSILAAEAIEEFLTVQEWQVTGIKDALTSLDKGKGIAHEDVKRWAASLGSSKKQPIPKAE